MALARQLKTNPRQLAVEIVKNLDVSDICLEPEIAGPGFINFRLKPDFLASRLRQISKDDARLGIEKAGKPVKVVVDFSGPNIAKQMHVGHLRSTIIGDAICRMLEFDGYEVIRQNHIGDWGTQFGMLIAYLRRENPAVISNPSAAHIADLEQFYRNAKELYDSDPDFAESARKEVINLHNHNPDTLKIWRQIVDESRNHYQPIYDKLSINLNENNERGESFYAEQLAGVVEELKAERLAVPSEGAVCVFPPGFVTKEGTPLPLIVQKSDGAFLYATTDLAALKYRVQQLGAKKIIYVTDARQSLHFEMVFAVAKMAGWVPDDIELRHVTFGSVLGEDGKPFKTRSGENVKLRDLLDEAVERARKVVDEKNPDLPESQKQEIADAVGIGSVKYADFNNNRTSDYVFSFDRMLSLEGNTAPYMQYAYARVRSIMQKGKGKGIDTSAELENLTDLVLAEPAEIELAKMICRYDEAIFSAASDFRPNILTAYLFDLAGKFSSFYTQCPVLNADPTVRPGRLLLCDLTARTISHGLNTLLGIKVVEQM
jgi:arginyl-tRNA synthetase